MQAALHVHDLPTWLVCCCCLALWQCYLLLAAHNSRAVSIQRSCGHAETTGGQLGALKSSLQQHVLRCAQLVLCADVCHGCRTSVQLVLLGLLLIRPPPLPHLLTIQLGILLLQGCTLLPERLLQLIVLRLQRLQIWPVINGRSTSRSSSAEQQEEE